MSAAEKLSKVTYKDYDPGYLIGRLSGALGDIADSPKGGELAQYAETILSDLADSETFLATHPGAKRWMR